MPDFWSHQIASKLSKQIFQNNQPKNLKWDDHLNALYYFGAQGPDFFYYINKQNPFTKQHFKHVGNMLHNFGAKDVFKAMIEYMHKNPSEILNAYVSGYISHYIIDVHCHPLICKLGPDYASHKTVELIFDSMIVLDVEDMDIHQMRIIPLVCAPLDIEKKIAPMWIDILKTCFSVDFKKSYIIKAPADMQFIQNLMVTRVVSKIPFKSALSKIFKYDLSSLIYETPLEPSFYKDNEYLEFKKYYFEGIRTTAEALKDLDLVLSSSISLDDYIDKWFKSNYLGEGD